MKRKGEEDSKVARGSVQEEKATPIGTMPPTISKTAASTMTTSDVSHSSHHHHHRSGSHLEDSSRSDLQQQQGVRQRIEGEGTQRLRAHIQLQLQAKRRGESVDDRASEKSVPDSSTNCEEDVSISRRRRRNELNAPSLSPGCGRQSVSSSSLPPSPKDLLSISPVVGEGLGPHLWSFDNNDSNEIFKHNDSNDDVNDDVTNGAVIDDTASKIMQMSIQPIASKQQAENGGGDDDEKEDEVGVVAEEEEEVVNVVQKVEVPPQIRKRLTELKEEEHALNQKLKDINKSLNEIARLATTSQALEELTTESFWAAKDGAGLTDLVQELLEISSLCDVEYLQSQYLDCVELVLGNEGDDLSIMQRTLLFWYTYHRNVHLVLEKELRVMQWRRVKGWEQLARTVNERYEIEHSSLYKIIPVAESTASKAKVRAS
eukprot:jgi/Bigna1/133603/aug1.22_g8311